MAILSRDILEWLNKCNIDAVLFKKLCFRLYILKSHKHSYQMHIKFKKSVYLLEK